MDYEQIIINLFTDKYTLDEKYAAMADLEINNPPLLDELIKKHQPIFWSKNTMNKLDDNFGKFSGYETHLMSYCLGEALTKYTKDKNYNPNMDTTYNRELLNKLTKDNLN